MVGFRPTKVFIAGVLSALAFILFYPLVNQFSIIPALLPLLLFALRKESLTGYYMTLVQAWVIVMIVLGLQAAIAYSWLILGPAFIVRRQYFMNVKISDNISWYPPGNLLCDYVVWNILGVIVFCAMVPQAELVKQLNHALLSFDKDVNNVHYQMATVKIKGFFKQLTYYHYGLNFIISTFITCGILARVQKFLMKTGTLVRPPLDFTTIILPAWLWLPLSITAILWSFLSADSVFSIINANILIVLLSGFFLQGLSVVHFYLKQFKNKQMILVIFYIVMILFTLLILIVTLLGILEPWLNLRQRHLIRKE